MPDGAHSLDRGDHVRHERFGVGTVEVDRDETVLVRFDHGWEECARVALRPVDRLDQSMLRPQWDVPLEVIQRAQAEAIRSVNSTWGVFSRSLVQLLPHQLWVCRQVNATWPTRWLVADDVGLGKTIEAGLILWPLLSRNVVRRLLVLCPASLVDQWQYRLRTMFDIRLAIYRPELDGPRTDFWGTHPMVVASLQTLRKDHGKRHERMLETPPWDLLIVDEAHHLNADEAQGPTLGYRLVKRLADAERFRSMVFFTGTPHRGKNFGFLSLLHLLSPDRFDPQSSMASQLGRLPEVMIRNNKATVTDLAGKRLFQDPLVVSETYRYSPQERQFYDLLTMFISTGEAYASSLSRTRGEAVILVLIAMQKLASSSVAAIRRALRGRLDRLRAGEAREADLEDQLRRLRESAETDAADEQSVLEESLVGLSASLSLMHDEADRIEQLLAAADEVVTETKIASVLRLLEERYVDRSVLFFTEYKATQSLLLSALNRCFGDGCATFINGDERATEVILQDGSPTTLSEPRLDAAERFTSGQVRFLVSTEAGGEGIDLQESCHTLIHLDLPWNPMRLHQRVGRLNRYGQTQRVEVLTLRNPDTVESLIWDRLNEKLDRVNLALQQVMDEPEDMRQLVLGMISPAVFTDLFSQAARQPRGRLHEWFDAQTAQLGGQDLLEAVRDLVGNASRFDFQQASARIPRVDLPDLRPFLEAALKLNGCRLREDEHGIAFRTPDNWCSVVGIRAEYEGLSLDRSRKVPIDRLLGAGHKALEQALEEAVGRDVTVAALPSELLPHPLIVFRIRDRVTDSGRPQKALVAALEMTPEPSLLQDWQLILRLNGFPWRRAAFSDAAASGMSSEDLADTLRGAQQRMDERLHEIEHDLALPVSECLLSLWPAKR